MARQIKVASSEAAKEIAAIMAAGCTYVSNYKHYDSDIIIHVNENGSRSYTEVYEGGEFSYISISGAASEPEAIIEIGNVEKAAATMAIDLRGYAAALIELDELRTEIYRAKKKIGRSRNEKAIAQAEEDYAALVKQEHEKDAAFWKNYGELNEQVQSDAALMAEYEKVCDELQAEQARQQAEENSKAVAAAREAEKNGYVAKISTSTGDKGIWRSSKKIFKSAVAAFKFLDKKEFAPLTYWSVEIEHNGETIYWNGGNGGIDSEGTTDAEIQALIDEENRKIAAELEPAKASQPAEETVDSTDAESNSTLLTVSELKAARTIFKELTSGVDFNDVWSCRASKYFLLSDQSKNYCEFGNQIWAVEIALRAIDEIEATAKVLKKWNTGYHYGFHHSSLSYDAQGVARSLEYKPYDHFSVTTTHDMDGVSFTRHGVDELVIDLLKTLFNVSHGERNIRAIASCYHLSGSKYRPTCRALAYKIWHMSLMENALIEDVEANDEPDDEENFTAAPVIENDDDDELDSEYWIVDEVSESKIAEAPAAEPSAYKACATTKKKHASCKAVPVKAHELQAELKAAQQKFDPALTRTNRGFSEVRASPSARWRILHSQQNQRPP